MKLGFIEKSYLISILESYKDMTRQMDNLGFFETLDEDYNADQTIRATEYFIKKFKNEGKKDSVNLDEILNKGGNK